MKARDFYDEPYLGTPLRVRLPEWAAARAVDRAAAEGAHFSARFVQHPSLLPKGAGRDAERFGLSRGAAAARSGGVWGNRSVRRAAQVEG